MLAVAIGVVYGPSLRAPFVFDDVDGIVNNDALHSLRPLVGPANARGPLNPPANLPSSGRPLVSLSLALNYQWGGLDPFGYHAVNLLIHFLAAMLVWAIVRKSLRLPYFDQRFDASAGRLALGVALLWALHPLQTEAVVYVTQRSELMMALCYLATLYCSLRYWTYLPLPVPRALGERRGEGALKFVKHESRRTFWLALAVLACLAGMASKEVMVSAPLMVLLFDRTFISGSLVNALRRSWPLYVGLASTWILLLALNIGAPRGNSAGFGVGPLLVTWWLTQTQVLLMYMKLVFWPWPLMIHYELPQLESFAQAWMYVAPVTLVGIGTLTLLWRNHPVGYLLAWPFVILAPTSVVPIITEMAAERRMYLPLAAIVVLVVVGAYVGLQPFFGQKARRSVPIASIAVITLVCALASAARIRAYENPMRLWRDVVEAQPNNALGHGNLGELLAKAGRLEEAINELRIATSLKPDDPTALANLGQALTESGRPAEAIEKLRAAIELAPDDSLALNNLGVALINLGRHAEAIEPLRRAVQVKPSFAMAHNTLGGALAAVGKNAEAIEQFELALRYDPSLVMARQNLHVLEQRNAHAAAGHHNTNRATDAPLDTVPHAP